MIRQEWDCSIEEANEKTASPVQGSTFPVSSGCGHGSCLSLARKTGFWVPCPRLCVGMETLKMLRPTAGCPDMFMQSREHGKFIVIRLLAGRASDGLFFRRLHVRLTRMKLKML